MLAIREAYVCWFFRLENIGCDFDRQDEIFYSEKSIVRSDYVTFREFMRRSRLCASKVPLAADFKTT